MVSSPDAASERTVASSLVMIQRTSSIGPAPKPL
jgi:hypothetical protein